jgi:GTP-binding protein YchF
MSFPSAHATTSFAAAALRARLPGAAPLLYGGAAMFALSRPYLGVHYPSDVLAGALLGTRSREVAAMMKVGIVGMPNAGKSSLFSALTGVAAEAANYPFTTIEPNIAVVPVETSGMNQVADTVKASKIVPDTIAFHDIAGLVAGAHKGEGLGNQFLANIRETDALVHVVRAHEDDGIIHPEGRVDPLADIETIETELIYADLEQAERRLDRVARPPRAATSTRSPRRPGCAVIEALQAGQPARTVPPPDDAPDARSCSAR